MNAIIDLRVNLNTVQRILENVNSEVKILILGHDITYQGCRGENIRFWKTSRHDWKYYDQPGK